MCKLCNTDRPAIQTQVYAPAMKEIFNLVHQYTGEFPCLKCKHIIYTYLYTKQTKSTDEFILSKLYRSYYRTQLSVKEVHLYEMQKQMQRPTVTKVILPGIQCVHRADTTTTAYIATVVNGRKTTYIGTYSTLQLAVTAKFNYLKKHNRTYALTILTKAIKEYNNEKSN